MTIKLTRLDLGYILTQIEMAEAGQVPVNPLLAFGLREVAGTNNNIAPGQTNFGASDQVFPALTDQMFQKAQFGTSYSQTSGVVVDAAPRTISLLIASQNAVAGAGADGILGTADDTFVSGNQAAFTSQQRALSFLGQGYQNYTLPGADGIYGTADDTGTTFAGPDGVHGHRRRHHHVRQPGDPDEGVRQRPDRPWSGAEPVHPQRDAGQRPVGAVQQLLHVLRPVLRPRPGQDHHQRRQRPDLHSADAGRSAVQSGSPTNFMIETRAQDLPGPDGILGTADDVHQYINQDTPFVDQSQTYASDPSHQAFLRAYMIGADGKLHSTGALLPHRSGPAMATTAWRPGPN